MSDDDIDNMDFDLPADLVAAPVNAQEQQLEQLGSQMEGMFPGFGDMAKMMPQQQQMFMPNPPSAAALEDSKMWLRIYPCYIDKKKSRLEGRKISVDDAVEKPCAIYMAKAAELLGLSVVLESEKRHPRDPFTFGRLRVIQNSRSGLRSKHLILVAISKKMEEAVGLVADEKGLIAAYAKFSLSELTLRPPDATSQSTVSPAAASSSNVTTPISAPTPAPVQSSSTSSSKTKKKKEKRKILRM